MQSIISSTMCESSQSLPVRLRRRQCATALIATLLVLATLTSAHATSSCYNGTPPPCPAPQRNTPANAHPHSHPQPSTYSATAHSGVHYGAPKRPTTYTAQRKQTIGPAPLGPVHGAAVATTPGNSHRATLVGGHAQSSTRDKAALNTQPIPPGHSSSHGLSSSTHAISAKPIPKPQAH